MKLFSSVSTSLSLLLILTTTPLLVCASVSESAPQSQAHNPYKESSWDFSAQYQQGSYHFFKEDSLDLKASGIGLKLGKTFIPSSESSQLTTTTSLGINLMSAKEKKSANSEDLKGDLTEVGLYQNLSYTISHGSSVLVRPMIEVGVCIV